MLELVAAAMAPGGPHLALDDGELAGGAVGVHAVQLIFELGNHVPGPNQVRSELQKFCPLQVFATVKGEAKLRQSLLALKD